MAGCSPEWYGRGTLTTNGCCDRFFEHAAVTAGPTRFVTFVDGLFHAVESGNILRIDQLYRFAVGVMKQF
jgi:hypothetical protein